FRTILYHEEQWHWSGIIDQLRYHPAASGRDPSGKRTRRRRDVYSLAATCAERGSWEGAMMSQKTILIVDDEDRLRLSLSYILQKEQYHVETVTSAEEALNCLRLHEYDLMFLDL